MTPVSSSEWLFSRFGMFAERPGRARFSRENEGEPGIPNDELRMTKE